MRNLIPTFPPIRNLTFAKHTHTHTHTHSIVSSPFTPSIAIAELHVAAQVAVTAPAAYATEGTGAPESMVMEDENGDVDQKTENFTLPRLHFSFSAKVSWCSC